MESRLLVFPQLHSL